eukprot:764568-Hanusia_phi.AAC.4
MSKTSYARNAQFNSVRKRAGAREGLSSPTDDFLPQGGSVEVDRPNSCMRLIPFRRHQRLLLQAENVQRDLQDELAKVPDVEESGGAREASESQAFAQHRDSMQRVCCLRCLTARGEVTCQQARTQINQQSEELEKLRSEVLLLRSELLSGLPGARRRKSDALAEKGKRDQALNEASHRKGPTPSLPPPAPPHLLHLQLQKRQERDLRTDIEARDKSIAALKLRLQAAEAAREEAKAHEAQAVSKLERELELMRERITAVGRGELLFQVLLRFYRLCSALLCFSPLCSPCASLTARQVGNARSMKEQEAEMEELKRENLNLKILVGDLERDKAKEEATRRQRKGGGRRVREEGGESGRWDRE